MAKVTIRSPRNADQIPQPVSIVTGRNLVRPSKPRDGLVEQVMRKYGFTREQAIREIEKFGG